jgi:hypothetical protein
LIRNSEQISVCFLVFIWFQYLIIEQYRKISIFIYLSFHTKILIYAYFFSSFFYILLTEILLLLYVNFRLGCSDLYYLFVRFYYRKKLLPSVIFLFLFMCICLCVCVCGWFLYLFWYIKRKKDKTNEEISDDEWIYCFY